jgi:aflatoxin B1 aldehyde reductase
VAAKHGVSGHAAALRWTTYHSVLAPKYDDAIIIGSSTVDQLNSNLDIIEQGPLPGDIVEAFSVLYNEVGEEGVPYHF